MGRVEFAERIAENEADVPHLSFFFTTELGWKTCQPCYGEINNCRVNYDEDDWEDDDYDPDVASGEKEIIVFHPRTNKFNQEVYDFVMGDEMFSHCFLDTSLEKGLAQGWDLNTDLPYDMVLGAMIALRYSFNTTEYCSKFQTLRDNGLSVKEAFLLGCFLTGGEGNLILKSHMGDHEVFGNISLDWLEDTTPKSKGKEPTKENATLHYGVWGLWGDHSGLHARLHEFFTSQLPFEERGSGFGRHQFYANSKENITMLVKALKEGVL